MQPEQATAPDARRQFVGRLAASVSHDVANRLAVARLIAESFTVRADLSDDDLAKLVTLATAIDEAAELMEQLSAVTGRRRAPAHVVCLETLFEQMQPLLRAALGGRAVAISGHAAAHADRAQVEAAVLRLVLGSRRGRHEPPLEIAIDSDGEVASITIEDGFIEFPAAPAVVDIDLQALATD
jgi:signal transduction histidine kinase